MTRIALVSDTHLSPRVPAFERNWRAAERWIAAEGFDLVVHLGDITADAIVRPAELGYARAAFDDLAVPIRFVPGNHDIGDNASAEGPGSFSPARLAEYEDVFGPAVWRHDVGGWHLLGLDAMSLGSGGVAEAAVLAALEVLVADAAGPIGLMLHKPLFLEEPEETVSSSFAIPPEPRARLLRALAGRDLRFVASGHLHVGLHRRVAGVEHLWVPSAAFSIPNPKVPTPGRRRVGVACLELGDGGIVYREPQVPGLNEQTLREHRGLYPDD